MVPARKLRIFLKKQFWGLQIQHSKPRENFYLLYFPTFWDLTITQEQTQNDRENRRVASGWGIKTNLWKMEKNQETRG